MVVWVCKALLEVNNWTVFDSLDQSSQEEEEQQQQKKPLHGLTLQRGPTTRNKMYVDIDIIGVIEETTSESVQ